jgi:hypothetical protein
MGFPAILEFGGALDWPSSARNRGVVRGQPEPVMGAESSQSSPPYARARGADGLNSKFVFDDRELSQVPPDEVEAEQLSQSTRCRTAFFHEAEVPVRA